jgi:hypothetical protein
MCKTNLPHNKEKGSFGGGGIQNLKKKITTYPIPSLSIRQTRKTYTYILT